MAERFNPTQEHFSSFDNLSEQIRQMINRGKKELYLKPPAIKDKPYTVKVSLERGMSPNDSQIEFFAFNATLCEESTRKEYPGMHLHCICSVVRDDRRCIQEVISTGNYANLSKDHPNQFQGITTLFSPIEDAISQAVADFSQHKLEGVNSTAYQTVAQTLQLRGYDLTELAESEGQMSKFRKTFSPRKVRRVPAIVHSLLARIKFDKR